MLTTIWLLYISSLVDGDRKDKWYKSLPVPFTKTKRGCVSQNFGDCISLCFAPNTWDSSESIGGVCGVGCHWPLPWASEPRCARSSVFMKVLETETLLFWRNGLSSKGGAAQRGNRLGLSLAHHGCVFQSVVDKMAQGKYFLVNQYV